MTGRIAPGCVVAVLVAGLAACGSTAVPTGSQEPVSLRSRTSASAIADAPTTGTGVRPTPRPSPAPSPTRSRPVPPPATPCAVTAKYRGKDLGVVPTTAKVAVLTFDGGASSTGAPSILSTLARTHTAATFFLTGDFARKHPGATTSIARAHPVGNHSNTHPDLTTLSSTAVVAQVKSAATAISAGTGRPPGPWFRFPYGARDARTLRLVNDQCYVAVRWTVDSLGWKGTSGGMTTTKVRDRVLAAARPGMIVLMHVGENPDDGTTLDAAALPAIIAGLRAKGYSFVTLQQAL